MVKNGMMQELKCKKQNVFDDFIRIPIAQNIRRQPCHSVDQMVVY
jgi:hypothetical protein